MRHFNKDRFITCLNVVTIAFSGATAWNMYKVYRLRQETDKVIQETNRLVTQETNRLIREARIIRQRIEDGNQP